MHTFIIAAVTADGFIARHSTHSPLTWRSQGDRQFFIERTKSAKVAIMGLNTAKSSKRPLPGRINIIYANDKSELPHWAEYGEWEITQEDPTTLIDRLRQADHKEVAICGGSQIYTMFMKAGLVDTIYLSVEPWLFGQGLHLFKEDIEQKLELVQAKNLEENTLLLEYKVINDKTLL